MCFIVPKDFGFKMTILAESSPNVNILPATTTIFKYMIIFIVQLFDRVNLDGAKLATHHNFPFQ